MTITTQPATAADYTPEHLATRSDCELVQLRRWVDYRLASRYSAPTAEEARDLQALRDRVTVVLQDRTHKAGAEAQAQGSEALSAYARHLYGLAFAGRK